MNNDVKSDDVQSDEDELEENEEASFDETIVMSEDGESDSGGDTSVERIIADFEKTDDQSDARKLEIRRRLEELAEEKSFEDTFAVDFDED